MNSSIRILAIALAVVSISACTKKATTTPTTRDPEVVKPMDDKPDTGMMNDAANDFSPAGLDRNPCLMARTVKFDLDRTEISGEFDAMIASHAKLLTINTAY